MAMVRCGLAIRSGWSRYQQCDRALGGCVGRIASSPQLHVLLADAARAAAHFPAPLGARAHGCLSAPAPAPAPSAPSEAPAAPSVPPARCHGHVLSGVEFGMGALNCLASVLPPIVLRVVSALGFPCDREAGMAQLRAAVLSGGPSTPVAGLFILAMRVLLPSFHSGDVGEHVAEAEAVLEVRGARGQEWVGGWVGGGLGRVAARVRAFILPHTHHPTRPPACSSCSPATRTPRSSSGSPRASRACRATSRARMRCCCAARARRWVVAARVVRGRRLRGGRVAPARGLRVSVCAARLSSV